MSIRKFRAARVTTTTGNTYVGQYGDVFYDESTGLMHVSDGVTPGGHFIPVNPATTTTIGGIIAGPGANVSTSGLLTINTAGLSFSFGNFYATGGNLSTVNANEDLGILTNGTGNVNIIGNLRLYATGTGQFGYGNTPLLSVANSGNLLINGNVITNGNTTVNGSYAFNGATVHTGNITTNGNLITNGTSYFNGPEFNVGNVNITGNLVNNGTTYNTGLLYQVGDSTVTGNLTINGITTFNGNTVRNGNITTNGNLIVYGQTINNGTTYNNGVQYQNGNLFVTGNTTFTVTLTSSNQGAVEITGNTQGLYQPPQNPGTTLHTTGLDTGNVSGRVYFDSINNYAVVAGRRYNGTIANPTALTSGQIIVRYAGTPYTSVGWPTVGPSSMNYVAGDNMTGTAQGGFIQFLTTANGTPTSSQFVTATIDPAIGVNAIGFQTSGNATIGNVLSNNYLFANGVSVYNTLTSNYVAADAVVTTNFQAGDAAVTTAWQSNAATQQTQINTLISEVYANANVASYLPTYSGNISAGNVAITNNETVGGNVTVTGNITANAYVYATSSTATPVTQATSKTTAVTANGSNGVITMNGAALASGAVATFTVNNSYVLHASDIVLVCIQNSVTAGAYMAQVTAVATGSFSISVVNNSGFSHSDAIVLNFSVIRVGS
jgi:hypothetical protein